MAEETKALKTMSTLLEATPTQIVAPITSNQVVWMIQPADNKFNPEGQRIMFRTEGELNKETDITSTDTMDGTLKSAGSNSEDASFTSYVVPRDVGLRILEYCRSKKMSVKVWRINLGDHSDGTGEGLEKEKGYLTDFFYALISNITQSDSTGEKIQLSASFDILFDSVQGRMELDQDIADTAMYGFENPSEWVGDLDDPNRKKVEA